MIKSMTGFGKGEASFETKKITVELRSLNSKQLDLNIKLPALYRQSRPNCAIWSRSGSSAARSTSS